MTESQESSMSSTKEEVIIIKEFLEHVSNIVENINSRTSIGRSSPFKGSSSK